MKNLITQSLAYPFKVKKNANRLIYLMLVISGTLLTFNVQADDNIKKLTYDHTSQSNELEILQFESNCVIPESIIIKMSEFHKRLKKKNYQLISISPIFGRFSRDSLCIFTYTKK